MKLDTINDLALLDNQLKVRFTGVRKGPQTKDRRNGGSSTSLRQEALASVLTISNQCEDEHSDSAEDSLYEPTI